MQGIFQSIIAVSMTFTCYHSLFRFVQFVVYFSDGYSLKIMKIEYNFNVGLCYDDVRANYNYVNGTCLMQLSIDFNWLDIVKNNKYSNLIYILFILQNCHCMHNSTIIYLFVFLYWCLCFFKLFFYFKITDLACEICAYRISSEKLRNELLNAIQNIFTKIKLVENGKSGHRLQEYLLQSFTADLPNRS